MGVKPKETIAEVYRMPDGDWAASVGFPCTVTDGFESELDAWKWVAAHYEEACLTMLEEKS